LENRSLRLAAYYRTEGTIMMKTSEEMMIRSLRIERTGSVEVYGPRKYVELCFLIIDGAILADSML